MTRDELFADVLADLNREDKADFLMGWLKATEYRVNMTMRVEAMVKRALLGFQYPDSKPIFALPSDFQEAKSLTIRTDPDPATTALGEVVAEAKYVPADHLSDGYVAPNAADPRGPLWFTTRGLFIEIGAWNAEGNYQAELWYYGDFDTLTGVGTTGASTNWLLTKAPHIYKLGMLHFGFANLQEHDIAQTKLGEFAAEIELTNSLNEKKKTPTGPLIMRPVRGFGAGVGRLRAR